MNRALQFRRRLIVPGAIVVGALLLAFYAGLRSQKQTENMYQWVSHTEKVLDLISQARLQRARLQNELWNYRVSGRPELPQLFQKDKADLEKNLALLRRLSSDNPMQLATLNQIEPLIDAQLATLTQQMEQAAKQADANQKTAAIVGSAPTSSENVRPLFDILNDNERRLLAQRTENVRASARRTRTVLLAAGTFALLVILVTGYLIQAEMTMRAEIEGGLRRARELLGGKYAENREALSHAMEDLHSEIKTRQRIENQIQQLNQDLEGRVALRTAELHEINQELEAFTYSVSHDLRAPLRHMEGFSRIIQQEYSDQLPEEARHYLKRIRDAATHMSALVEDLLHLSKIGRQIPHRKAVALQRMAEDAQAEVMEGSGERNIEWKFGELPEVEADSVLLRQVFVNLYANAVKFTRGKEPAKIETAAYYENGECVVRIKDNGAGFDPQFADKLFGVFQRLHRQDEFEGTGIGLASIQRIVHKHGGRVWAESLPGQGATFYFTLPMATKQAEQNSEPIGATA